MLDLFRGELRRFRWLALAVGVVHFGTLAFFDRVVDVLQQPRMLYQLVAAIYVVAGALLGLYQAGTYRRINAWISLLHRPIAAGRILTAIAGAGVLLLVAAVLVPLLILLASHGLVGARFVDARQWLLPVAALLIAVIGYLGGLYAMLSPRRYGWLALVAAALLSQSAAAGWHVLVIQAVVALALAALVRTVFKPDLATPPETRGGLAGTAVALAFGGYLLAVVAGDLVFQTVWIATGTHPLNSTPPAGGVVEATRAEGAAVFEAGLAGRNDRQARIWREQARLSEVFALPPVRAALPGRGELTNIAPIEFDDALRGVRWTFSHDDMRFHGVRLADRARNGVLGVERGTPFPAPPMLTDEGMMIAAGGVYGFDKDTGVIRQRVHLPTNETLATPVTPVGEAVAVLSDRALRLYDRRVLDDGDAIRKPLASVPLPAPIGNLMRVDLIELLDGYLVSLTYARDAIDGPADAWQQILLVNGNGRVSSVARRHLAPDFPLLSRYSGWWLSPSLTLARTAAEQVLAAPAPLSARMPIRVPPTIWGIAAALALVSAAGAGLLARQRRLGSSATVAWAFAALLLGPTMLLGQWLIRPEPRR